MAEKNVVYSEVVKVKGRRYFFDVIDYESGTVLAIKESRLVNGENRSQVVYLWESDVVVFMVALANALAVFDDIDDKALYQLLRDGFSKTPYKSQRQLEANSRLLPD